MIPNQSTSAVLVFLIDEECAFRKLAGLGRVYLTYSCYIYKPQYFAKVVILATFKQRFPKKAVLPSVLLLCDAVNAADFLTKNDFGMFQS